MDVSFLGEELPETKVNVDLYNQQDSSCVESFTTDLESFKSETDPVMEFITNNSSFSTPQKVHTPNEPVTPQKPKRKKFKSRIEDALNLNGSIVNSQIQSMQARQMLIQTLPCQNEDVISRNSQTPTESTPKGLSPAAAAAREAYRQRQIQRQRRGTATDPQSIAARNRRERISQKIRQLGVSS